MAVRRTIDSLIEEFASMRRVSNDNAIRIALMEAIAHEKEPEFDPEVLPVAKQIAMWRVWIAYTDGQDGGSEKMLQDLATPCVFSTLFLILSLFAPGARVGLIGVAIIFLIASLYYYHRGFEKSREEHTKNRETINSYIEKMKNEVPDELEFLKDGPTHMDVLLTLFHPESDSTQATR